MNEMSANANAPAVRTDFAYSPELRLVVVVGVVVEVKRPEMMIVYIHAAA